MTEPDIHVSILTNDEIQLELTGDYICRIINEKLTGKFTARIVSDKIVMNDGVNDYPPQKIVYLTPTEYDSNIFLLKGVKIGIDFHWEQKRDLRFFGSLKLIIDNGKINAINVISIEDYLMSVISSEMSGTSSMALLKSQAVVARSWLLSQIERKRYQEKQESTAHMFIEDENEIVKWYDREDHKLFDVCADDHCQRYQGLQKAFTDKVLETIDQTRGLVLKQNDRICDTRYSKCCGGITESFENVWEPVKHDYLQSIVDYRYEPDEFERQLDNDKDASRWIQKRPQAFCNTTDNQILSQVLVDFDLKTPDFYRWKVEYTQDELKSIICEKTKIDFGDIIDLVPLERGFSGRIIRLKITGSIREMIIGKELEIRRVLSKSHLYSSAFVVDKYDYRDNVPRKFVISGAGWGHGVGMCQIGAAVMGEQGYQFDEILLHYFKGATIQRIYS
ncbi:MAG: SpoIID/LytB domain-containing protein [Melioribacteraceae bacterium]|nr:SpoIID/LytB domain-containing protein [Melioribacteraceae bacterium]MCF8355016.1 SpoIID/LytB domain-containing protein [Melioribacteraceae bacterium]MCF8394341.1 SpoIID/LytB domain-containing protein [Melioribacteraceae bacterium]MCF8420020.1 SpoIID/LytB domain-containing protein [Melioribacteraceae bacterium]